MLTLTLRPSFRSPLLRVCGSVVLAWSMPSKIMDKKSSAWVLARALWRWYVLRSLRTFSIWSFRFCLHLSLSCMVLDWRIFRRNAWHLLHLPRRYK